MPEVHLIGSVVGATGCVGSPSNLFCRWEITTGAENWKVLEGSVDGQTQINGSDECVWDHPIDAHFSATSVKGWPKFNIQVFHQDEHGRNDIFGYGFFHVPTTSGDHEIECAIWRPEGSTWDTISAFFLGGQRRLKRPDVVTNELDRFFLKTSTVGVVQVKIHVVTRSFDGIEF
jgi:B9 domain-containing protein 2